MTVRERRQKERKEFREYIKISDDKVLDTKKYGIELLGDDEIFVQVQNTECYWISKYPNQYRKDTKIGFKWLNENATILDFENLDDLLTRLVESTEITSEIRELFNRKSAYIFVAAFKAFTKLGREDKEFGEFLHWLIAEGKNTEINGKTWTELDVDRSTRDSNVVHGKLDYLTALINQYFTEVKKVA